MKEGTLDLDSTLSWHVLQWTTIIHSCFGSFQPEMCGGPLSFGATLQHEESKVSLVLPYKMICLQVINIKNIWCRLQNYVSHQQ